MFYGSRSADSYDERTLRTLLALPELGMRVRWAHDFLTNGPLVQVAQVFDRIACRSRSADCDAKEALLPLAILLSQLHDSSWVWALTQAVKQHHLLNLERMVRPSSDPAPGPESTDYQVRLPLQIAGRDLTVGERRSLARRPTREELARLLLDPHPLVLSQLLQCPTLTEHDVISMVTRRPPRAEALRLLIESPRWIARRRVRLSIILNPGSHHGIALPFVATLPREDLSLIASTTTINQTLRTVAHELYRQLPPVHASTHHPMRH